MENIQQFCNIHHTIWGDAGRIVGIIADVCEAMFRRRGAVTVERNHGGDVTKCITNGKGHVMWATSDTGKRWDLYIHAEERVGVKYARSVLDECEARDGSHAVVVSIEGPTPFTRRECEDRNIQFFLAREMTVNIVDHCLVPKHELVDAPPEGILVENLPRMEATDKIAQYYDWKPGTIVKITRVFGGSEPIPYYRQVVTASGA